jgi:hypothetical protein
MTNIDFNINASRIQEDYTKGLAKAAQREQQAALFDLQSAGLRGEAGLDAVSETALRVILNQYDGNGALSVAGSYELFPDYMHAGLNDIFASLKRADLLAGFSLDMSGWSVLLTPGGLLYFEDRKKTLGREAAALKKLMPDAARLLWEIIDSADPAAMLRERFRTSAYYENKELSGMLRELVSQGYIRIPVWKDDVPQLVEIDDVARMYTEQETVYQEFIGRVPELPLNEESGDSSAPKPYDLFLCYAGRDRSVYTDKLHQSLSRLGAKILV